MQHKLHCFFISFFVVFSAMLQRSIQLQLQSDLYQLSDPTQSNNIYFSTTRNKRQRSGKIQTVLVYDEFTCFQQCARLADDCIAMNFMKRAVNKLHDCELLSFEGKLEDNSAFEYNSEFDFIVIKNPQFQNCGEMYKKKVVLTNGVHRVRPRYSPSFLVYCNMKWAGGGWTVILRRKNGLTDFYRDWDDYKRGFGKISAEHWLGLDHIHAMTSQGDYRLRVDLFDFDGNHQRVEYGTFIVAGEEDNYRLTIGKYEGLAKAGDSLTYHNNAQFSTKDRDNDSSPGSCAKTYRGGWWYQNCHETNLNGLYLAGPTNQTGVGITWKSWRGQDYSLKNATLKIRPNDYK